MKYYCCPICFWYGYIDTSGKNMCSRCKDRNKFISRIKKDWEE